MFIPLYIKVVIKGTFELKRFLRHTVMTIFSLKKPRWTVGLYTKIYTGSRFILNTGTTGLIFVSNQT